MTVVVADEQAADLAAVWFQACYRTRPQGVWRAPGRVNLIGEHTDYNHGWVLPFALNSGVTVAAARRDDGMLEVRSQQAAGVLTEPVTSLCPGALTDWTAYPAGVAWALGKAGHQPGGASIAVCSDLPQGAGLASSAALECAVALALVDLYGLAVPRAELAEITRRAENEFVGVPCGVMDQSASLLCADGRALLLDCRRGSTESVPLDPAAAGMALLIVDTGARHTLADGRYSLRREQCRRAARAIGVDSLRDAKDVAAADRLADPVLRRRARHVISENRRVLDAAALLRDADLAGVGTLLRASHASLRDDFEISWPQADAAVDAAGRAGALGARMMGGGFGGSVIVLLPGEGAPVHSAVTRAYRSQGWAAPRFLAAHPSAGARRVR